MMEQLAERRMQREEDARYGHTHYPPQSGLPAPHNHSHASQFPVDNDDYPEDEESEDDDSYNSQEEYAEDEDDVVCGNIVQQREWLWRTRLESKERTTDCI